MRINKKIKSTVICTAVALSVLAGCSLGGKSLYFSTGLSKNEVFKIKGSACTKSEAMLLLTTEKNLYENSFGSDVWSQDIGGITLSDYVKGNVKSQLAQMKTMSLLAKKEDIKLTDDEKEKVSKASNEYFDALSDKEKDYMDVDIDDVEEMYSQYIIANKVYEELTKDINPEISDADAKVIKVQSIYAKTYSIDSSGNRVEYGDSEKQNAKKSINSLLDRLNSGEDFTTIAANNTDADKIEYQFGKGDMIKEFEDAAFSLTTGQMSGVVETPDGYYIIKCISDYMQDETQTNKQKMVDAEKEKAFKAIYDPFVESVSSEFNDELWDSIDFSKMTDIKVSNFYDIITK